ncbi:response regulator [Flavitalea flava]
MNRGGPVVIIEDDEDDQELLMAIFKKLPYTNEIIFFGDSEEALVYLNRADVSPFLIISDVNMPRLNGFALRDKIRSDSELHTKCIPYLFFSTNANHTTVLEAYSLSVQGFFIKESSMSELEKTITVIMDYWIRCIAPNDF